jgi:hypothetical protein
VVRVWARGLDRHQSISPKSSLAIATISEDADWWFPTPLIGVNEWPQMKNPLQVVFQGCEPSDQARAVVEREFERIEARDNRITSSRVTVIGPGDHHRHGAGFQIHILLTMPPQENVVVNRSPADEKTHEHPEVAIKDAFAVARRQIEDLRQPSQVGAHPPRGDPSAKRIIGSPATPQSTVSSSWT